MEAVKRIYFYNRKLFFTYRTEYYAFVNDACENRPWHYQGEFAVSIGFGNKLFDKANWYYDGHTIDSIAIFGLEFSKMYTYQSEELK